MQGEGTTKMELRSENSRYEPESSSYISSRFNIRTKRAIHVGIGMNSARQTQAPRKNKALSPLAAAIPPPP